jgi:hypothetical protein
MTIENTLSFVYDSCKNRTESLVKLRKKLVKSCDSLEDFIINDEKELISYIPDTVYNSLIDIGYICEKIDEEIKELKKITKQLKFQLNKLT